MPDFTSALYLGLHHETSSLAPWNALTTGRPAALTTPPETESVARGLATLVGTEAATLAPSTLHLFWDLGERFGRERALILLDAGCYPVARWGMEHAAACGATMERLPHRDPHALHWRLRRQARLTRRGQSPRRVVFVTDGFCPHCGRVAPLAAYAECLRPHGGLLLIDDTQALGILGASPNTAQPYGRDGGGAARWCGVSGPNLLIVASLAKGFGAPLAALAGARPWIDMFLAHSQTRQHCSPPSLAAIRAAQRALALNATHGERWRERLLARVRKFRAMLGCTGCHPIGGWFPAQTLLLSEAMDVDALRARLQRTGVRAVWHRPAPQRSAVTFLLTVRHTWADLARARAAIAPNHAGKNESETP